jgi:hypothetical protein
MNEAFVLEKEKIAEAHRLDCVSIKVTATKAIGQSEKKAAETLKEMELKNQQTIENLKLKYKEQLEFTKQVIHKN